MKTFESWMLSYLLNSLWQASLLFAAGSKEEEKEDRRAEFGFTLLARKAKESPLVTAAPIGLKRSE